MNTFEAIDKFLTGLIETYKIEAKRVGIIASEGCALSPYDLNRLAQANAQAEGAMQAQHIINQQVAYSQKGGEVSTVAAQQEALPRIIRQLETRMDVYLTTPETPLESVKVINDVLRSLRLETEAVAAK